VIRRGIAGGRETFANTLKYVLTTTSANLGNMVSMAVASLFLPFLPLLAGQILLRRPFFRSKSGRVLLLSTLGLIPATFVIPYLSHIGVLGFVRLAPSLLAALALVTMLYVFATELMKRWFYRRAA
jgi:hypothetical protein